MFTCPEWALNYWNPRECQIVKCTDGKYAVLDHSIQTTVFVGTEDECKDFLGSFNPDLCI